MSERQREKKTNTAYKRKQSVLHDSQAMKLTYIGDLTKGIV